MKLSAKQRDDLIAWATEELEVIEDEIWERHHEGRQNAQQMAGVMWQKRFFESAIRKLEKMEVRRDR